MVGGAGQINCAIGGEGHRPVVLGNGGAGIHAQHIARRAGAHQGGSVKTAGQGHLGHIGQVPVALWIHRHLVSARRCANGGYLPGDGVHLGDSVVVIVIHQQVAIGQQGQAPAVVKPGRRAHAVDIAWTVQQTGDRGHLTIGDLADGVTVQFADIHRPIRRDDDAGGVVE